MKQKEDPTREKILLSALALFSERGIAKTSLTEVAYHAGVTRVTVYRHFAEKKGLVREVFLRVEQVFQKGLTDLKQNPHTNSQEVLDRIGGSLSALPSGDAAARMDELMRLYPDVYGEVQQVRVVTLNGLFEHLFARAERGKMLRPGLNRRMVQAIFWELVINFFDNPKFKSLGLSDAELFRALTDLFLYGIFKNRAIRIRKVAR
jgi:AcrR family transcriptional regulator